MQLTQKEYYCKACGVNRQFIVGADKMYCCFCSVRIDIDKAFIEAVNKVFKENKELLSKLGNK